MAVTNSTRVLVLLLLLLLQCIWVSADWTYTNPNIYPDVPSYGPQPNPAYMVDNTHNYYHVAPDKGKQNGPVWQYSGSFENYMSNLHNGHIIRGSHGRNHTVMTLNRFNSSSAKKRQDSSYWLTTLGPLGSQPLAPSGYKFYRNVVDDYGADNTGGSDASESINAAISDGNRCGEECGNDFISGAIIYFPPGTYQICSPIIQLYYTQFIGDVNDRPIIQGYSTFSGIALIDTDPYIPGGSGSQWFVNQNQFFRHIRNFIFDLTQMPLATDDDDQPLVPTGIHWQVAQATTLQNLEFNMPDAISATDTTAVGIFSENGSGGFVSDLVFNGGNIGWRAGSQQYTARNLKFNNCLTAIQMVWDWGWTWQGVTITGGAIGFNISGVGGDMGQGIGSVSIIDSSFSNVPVGILTNSRDTSPNIVLDNVVANGVGQMVQVDGGSTLLSSSGTIDLWATGKVYNGSVGSLQTGDTAAPVKAKSLLASNGDLFVQSRPQYETFSASQFLVATTDGGCKNDGTGDQTSCLNVFLQKAVSSTQIAYFPAGIYQVGGTVLIPTGSRVQGSSWSQIQGPGYYFSDMQNPKVVVQVGNAGDIGTMEIVEMLVSVRGNTAGAVLMEWNVAALSQGAAAMWDTHFRVGGGTGTDLDIKACPKRSFNDQCIAASLMFHVTKQASGYFENVWAWVADHDNDDSLYDNFDTTANQISVYGARGMLVESQGPSWFYGTSSEHSVLYNYQLSGAKDIFMGHIQTETPYYQPDPIAPAPFDVAASFPNDPDFSGCDGDPSCAATWGLRVVDSSSVTIHGAGLYSFFQNYYQDCLATFNCQERILEVVGSTDVVIFNLFTVATSSIAVGIDNTVIFQNDTNQRGFTTEDAVWLPLDGADNIDTVFVGTQVWTASTVTCSDTSCLLVFPTSSLSSSSTITPSPYTTSFQYGGTSTVTVGGVVTVTFITTTTTTVITIPPITIGGMPFSNYNMSSGQPTIEVQPSVNVPPITIGLPNGSGTTTSRVVPLPPWPQVNDGPTVTETFPDATGGTSTYFSGITSVVTATGPTVTTVSFPATIPATTVTCPPISSIVFATPSITVNLDCPTATTWAVGFNCPSTKVVTFLGPTTGQVSVDCTLVTVWSAATSPTTSSTSTSSTTTPLPVWATWPPGIIVPVTTSVIAPEPTTGGTIVPCKLWFFFICISHENLQIGGWFWSFPPGIYPPGPPPPIQWPPGFTLKGTLPPWPTITIGNDQQLTYKSEPDDQCTTETASVCSTTTSFFGTTTTGGETVTTSSTTTADCETVYGCDVTDSNTATQTTTVAVCSIAPSARKVRRLDAHATQGVYSDESNHGQYNRSLERRAGDCVDKGVIVYPRDPLNVASINLDLAFDENIQIQSTNLKYTAYFWVPSLPAGTKEKLNNNPDVATYYDYVEWNENTPNPGSPNLLQGFKDSSVEGMVRKVNMNIDEPYAPNASQSRNPASATMKNLKRVATSGTPSIYFNTALLSLPPGQKFKDGVRGGVDADGNFLFYYDDSAGAGATVYAISEVGAYTSSPDIQGVTLDALTGEADYGYPAVDNPTLDIHSTAVCGAVAGKLLGSCKKCRVVYSGHPVPAITNQNSEPRDWYLEELLTAWDDMTENGHTPQSSVINISWGSPLGFFTPYMIKALYDILKRMDRAGVTIVVSAGNWGNTPDVTTGQLRTGIDTYPQLFAQSGNPKAFLWQDDSDVSDLGYLPNMIVVGAADRFGNKAKFSQDADFLTTYAYGKNADTASQSGYDIASGTSFAAPQVAGLAAYFKQLPSIWQDELNQADSDGPRFVKALIVAFQREITLKSSVSGTKVKMVWNGMDEDTNCLLDYPQGDDPNNVCPKLPTNLISCGLESPESALLVARDNNSLPLLDNRQDGSSCTVPGGGGDGGGGDGIPITVTTGPTVGPTCAGGNSACGGVVCTGYWCAPTPTGFPPGYQDPSDPSSSGHTASTTTVSQGFGGDSSSSTSTKPSPTTTTAAPAPTPSNQITIIYSPGCDDVSCYSNYYVYSVTPGGQLDNLCDIFSDPDPIFVSAGPDDGGDELQYPTSLGTFDDGDFKNCKYTGNSDGTGEGTFSCDGFAAPTNCFNYPADSIGCNPCPNSEGVDEYCFEVYCEW